MGRLIGYEFGKVWRKKSFLVILASVICFNLFFLWYLNTCVGDQVTPAAYKKVSAELAQMESEQRIRFVTERKELLDGVFYVQGAAALLAGNPEMELQEPETWDRYHQIYEDGGYLRYAETLEEEKQLFDELSGEAAVVDGYGTYLESVQDAQNLLGGVSIFSQADEENFSSHNIRKSGADYAGLDTENIRWMPSKGIQVSMESPLTDLLLLLLVFSFLSISILEEKQKELFYFTRPTRHGKAASITAKLAALFVHAMFATGILYGMNLLFSGFLFGWPELTARLQSLSIYSYSSFSITILEYLLLAVFSKGIVLFCLGAFLCWIAIRCDKNFVMPLCAVGIFGCSALCYLLIPAGSRLAVFKYLNLYAFLRTGELYGGYLNLNLFEIPVSRLALSALTILILTICAVLLTVWEFQRGKNLSIRKTERRRKRPFRLHGRLLRYEGYKTMVMNRGAVILLIFAVLLGASIVSKQYVPSLQEQYYREMMEKLEGGLTSEKETLISSEEARYQNASEQIRQIDEKLESGEITEETAENMKVKWYGELAFYPAFERIREQYDHIMAQGGRFVYDTGYLYLFGQMDDSQLTLLLLSALCFILTFSNVLSMEYQKGAWKLIRATAKGTGQVIRKKFVVCVLCVLALTLFHWIVRWYYIGKTYPMGMLTADIQNISAYAGIGLRLPIWGMAALSMLAQFAAGVIMAAIILLLSQWRKNYLQTVLFSVLILVLPLVLTMMGFDVMKWFSVYPLFHWSGFAS